MESEHRHAPRYQFIAEAEVTEISSDTKLIAKTSDLSLGGCFLDMLNPSPAGTDVQIRISHKSATFTTLGRVVFVLPNMGMGVEFRSVDDDQQAILQEWISELSRAE
jgi:PilZ domain